MITGRLYEAALCNEKEKREKVQSKSKAGAKAIPIEVYWENGKPGKMQLWPALCTGAELEFLIKRCIRHRKNCFKEELNFSPKEHEVLYQRHEIQNNLVELKALASASFRDFFLQSCGVVLSLKAGS